MSKRSARKVDKPLPIDDVVIRFSVTLMSRQYVISKIRRFSEWKAHRICMKETSESDMFKSKAESYGEDRNYACYKSEPQSASWLWLDDIAAVKSKLAADELRPRNWWLGHSLKRIIECDGRVIHIRDWRWSQFVSSGMLSKIRFICKRSRGLICCFLTSHILNTRVVAARIAVVL